MVIRRESLHLSESPSPPGYGSAQTHLVEWRRWGCVNRPQADMHRWWGLGKWLCLQSKLWPLSFPSLPPACVPIFLPSPRSAFSASLPLLCSLTHHVSPGCLLVSVSFPLLPSPSVLGSGSGQSPGQTFQSALAPFPGLPSSSLHPSCCPLTHRHSRHQGKTKTAHTSSFPREELPRPHSQAELPDDPGPQPSWGRCLHARLHACVLGWGVPAVPEER